jgi:predicted phosphodiesterase
VTRFRYIHLSDVHLCLEPGRHNAVTLLQRQPRGRIDTGWAQTRNIGFFSLAKPASYVPEIVSGVAQFCFQRAAVSDGILVTGDVATTGMMSDINVAYSFVADRASGGYVTSARSPTLNTSNTPIYVLPGNHDKFVDVSGTPNCQHFELKFGAYMRNFSSGVGHWIRRKQDCLLGFIYADFCLLSRTDAIDKAIGAYGQGRVYQHILDELRKRTLLLRNRYGEIRLVWVIHFAPFDCGYGLQLIDFATIIQAALALGVVATLCGHTHKASKLVIDKHVVYCSGSAGCVDSEVDSRVHVIHFDIDKECQVSRETYRWDGGHQEFRFHNYD